MKLLDGLPATLVPLRFISEAFGAKVEWNQSTKGITILWEPF
ncbi:MAG TPA: stalk domain-containing protein [Caldisericia bacterium]|nr:stalk domain-containing protein [Caldisericia bacterium]HPV87039.1 stalk domain-containing protein [Caldisericia bacterium]